MKGLIVLILLAAGGYFAYTKYQDRPPEVIEDPVYAEMRIGMKVPGRDLDMVLFGEMADASDCKLRTLEAWNRVIGGCKECRMTLSDCKDDIDPRYRRMFENQPTYSTYLSFTRGSRHERNGRMVIFGLTSDEGDAICDMVKVEFQKQYTGQVQCIRGRRD